MSNNQEDPKVPDSAQVNGKIIAEQKREKFRVKQQLKLENDQKSKDQDEWFKKYSNCTTRIDVNDVKKLKELSANSTADTIAIPEQHARKRQRVETSSSLQNASDLQSQLEYIRPYMNLKETSSDSSASNNDHPNQCSNSNATKDRRYFIAEGTETVRMLLERSAKDKSGSDLAEIKIHSILTKPSPFFEDPVNLRKTLVKSYPDCFQGLADGSHNAGDHVGNGELPFQIVVGSEKALTEIVGFPVARGAMACGIVPNYDEIWLDAYLSRKYKENSCIRILALDAISDTANLGSLIRSSAAFGIHAVILSEDSCDVWYRRCVRVSMGHVLTVPSVRVSDLSSTLNALRRKYEILSYAAVIDKDADMVLEQTERGGISKNWCCVLGNEGNGLSSQVASSCDHTIRIDMTDSIDSLSVGVAAGILLHGMREREVKAIPK